ncbi:MAG: carboxylesterase family protein [Alphaproteobacteria bacterium]|nr:carboxylesterase family protein [Alphaproteobacteria bacterium]
MRSYLLGALALVLAAGHGLAHAEPVTAKPAAGQLAGEMADGVAVWRGVPYAAAPVGELRWKPPQPAAIWDGERAATEFGASCTQNARLGAEARISEDCLYLNIYAPPAARKAPVMVWIHGGSNINGSGAIYNGTSFAKNGVVLVTVNYRLGALGFFAHPALTQAAGPADPLANYGLMDQTAALNWVKANISAFGGDPRNVTVFGESAGAINIYALLGLPTSKGLFKKAIIESNITWGDSAPLASAEQDGKALMVRAGAAETATLAELRAIPALKLIEAAKGALFPIVDRRFMKETSLQAVANGRVMDVPTIIGTNSYEASLVQSTMEGQALTDWTNAQAGAPARYIAAKTAGGKPSWLYFFSYVDEARRASAPGAAHATEIPYVFGGRTRPDAPAVIVSAEDKAMAALMHSCWVAFAKTGQPKCATGPKWPAYKPKLDQLMEFATESGVRAGFRKAELDAAEAAQAGAR